jgi:hypothetical protein
MNQTSTYREHFDQLFKGSTESSGGGTGFILGANFEYGRFQLRANTTRKT